TITKAYWLGSRETPGEVRQTAPNPKAGEAQLLIHGDEWFAEEDHLQYRQFMIRADKDFVFHAKGHPDVKGKIDVPYGPFWTNGSTGLREILVIIPKVEYANMRPGVAYSIRPANSSSAFKWKVKEGVSVTKDISLEERLDAILKRLDTMEKRLELLEKRR